MSILNSATGVSQVTTGRLIGSIVDHTGAPLRGVAVTISSPALIGGAQVKTVDDRGEFSFISIAPGTYSVAAVLDGFVAQERTSVQVPLGGAAAVHISMPRATFVGEMVVTDETPVVDPTQVNSGQVFDAEYMQASAIGSVHRSYTAVANQTAGVDGGAAFGGVSQPRVFGSTIGENAYFIDGMDTTDSLTATAFVNINFDTIAEIQFQTGGFEAEYGRATGGVLNVLTKSGGNRFSGTLDARFRDQSFQASGEHFDASTLETSYQDYSFTLGGPVVQDRLWFFAAYQWVNDRFTPVDSPTTRDASRQNFLAKLTWQIDHGWRLSGRFSGDPTRVDNESASRFVLPEATSKVDEGTTVVSTELAAVLSDNVLLGATLGAYRLDVEVVPQSGDLQTVGHANFDTGLWTENYRSQEYAKNHRADFTTDLTWFVADLAGSHEFKAGVEFSSIEQTIQGCSTGSPNGERCVQGVSGFFFFDIEVDGVTTPFLMQESQPQYESTYSGIVKTAFVQDSWRLSRDVTLKIGLRYDTVAFDDNDGTQVADLGKLQPRIGLAWDLAGNAKNVLRGSWGRFMHPGALSIPVYASTLEAGRANWLSCSGFLEIGSAEQCSSFASGIEWLYRRDHEGWDSAGWVRPPGPPSLSEPAFVATGLRPTYADELILAFEREIGNRSSIELMFVDKKTRDVIDDTCSGNVPIPSPDADCASVIVGNIPGAQRDYRGFVLSYENRGISWLTVLASYAYSSSRGSIEYTQNRGVEFDLYPWHFDNRSGLLSDHRRHRFKLNGFFTLKGDWNIAFDARWTSPFTWQPTEGFFDNMAIEWGDHFLEPRGNREAVSNHQLDLQLAKGFTIGSTRLVAIGSVYNVFSSEQAVGVCQEVSGCGGFEMGEATRWQTPRRYEIGFRVEF